MPEVSDYLLAVSSHWVALMSGLTSLLVGIWLRLKRRADITHKAFWFIGALCIVLAMYLAWHDERTALIKEREMHMPVLKTHIDRVHISDWPGESGSSMLVIIMDIRNLGAPSVVMEYQCQVSIQGDTPKQAKPWASPDKLILGNQADNQPPYVYYKQDSLAYKLAENPLPKGGLARGFVYFKVEGVRSEPIKHPSTTIEIRIADVRDRWYSARVRVGDSSFSGPRYEFPGLTR